VDNAFATDVSYSAGHLTSILYYDPRTPANTVAERRAQGRSNIGSWTNVDLPTQTVKNIYMGFK